jgi:hypothetical protein
MNITKRWLRKHDACNGGLEWFKKNFPRGGYRYDVLKKLEEADELAYYNWLLRKTLRQCPLPEGWVLPQGLTNLYLGGGTLPPGTLLPEGLRVLRLDGGTLPPGTVLPESLWWVFLEGGTLPPGTVLPEGLQYLYLGSDTPPEGLEIPAGCEVYE